jgi:hypothetical protein
MVVATSVPRITAAAAQQAVAPAAPMESGSVTIAEERLTAGQAIKLICRVLHRADPDNFDDAQQILEGIRDVIAGTGMSAALVKLD